MTFTASPTDPAPPAADGLVGLVTDLVERLGAPGAGLAVALENLFPPIPSEVILPLAGFTAGQGKMSLLAALVWTTLGSVVGALALYWVGAVIGRDRLRALADRLPLIKVDDFDRTEAWFARHGAKAVFFGRMIPIFRSLISIPAGVERMPVGRFLLCTTLGSAIWNVVFVMAGYQLGENWHAVETYAGGFKDVVKVVCLAAAAAFAVFLLLRHRRDRVASMQPATAGEMPWPAGEIPGLAGEWLRAEDGTGPQAEHGAGPQAGHGAGPQARHGAGPQARHDTEPWARHSTEPWTGHGTEPQGGHSARLQGGHGTEPRAGHGAEPQAGHGTVYGTPRSGRSTQGW